MRFSPGGFEPARSPTATPGSSLALFLGSTTASGFGFGLAAPSPLMISGASLLIASLRLSGVLVSLARVPFAPIRRSASPEVAVSLWDASGAPRRAHVLAAEPTLSVE